MINLRILDRHYFSGGKYNKFDTVAVANAKFIDNIDTSHLISEVSEAIAKQQCNFHATTSAYERPFTHGNNLVVLILEREQPGMMYNPVPTNNIIEKPYAAIKSSYTEAIEKLDKQSSELLLLI